MEASDLEGIIPAAVVPMRSDYSIDFDVFGNYLNWLITQGAVGVAVNVDTGEGPYLTSSERATVIQKTKEVSDGKSTVIAGVSGPSTLFATENAKIASDAGADALLVFPSPTFLNDPLDVRIMYDYHKAVAEASGLPLIVFQLGPIFGGVNYPAEALARVLELPQVLGLKDASFDMRRFTLTRDIVFQADHPITLLTGNDNFLLESFLLGAQGGLLGYGAVGAGLLVEMYEAVKNREFDKAKEMQARVQGFCDYIYGNPIGDYRARCKVALVHMALFSPEQTFVRPPYLSLWEEERETARRAVEKAGLIRIGV